jgi:hypothetical protein
MDSDSGFYLPAEPQVVTAPDVPEIPPGTLRPTTYGPSSPGATPADKKEFIGNANNALKSGDVALQPETAGKYGLKTGDKFSYEGKTYNYADTPAAKVGNVIDVYHPKGGFDLPDSPGVIQPSETPAPRAEGQATVSQNGQPVNPAYFDLPDTPATPTPPEDKNAVAGHVGAAIAQGGAAFAQSQQPVQPINFQYRTPPVPTSQGNEVKPIAKLNSQDWANLLYRATFKIVAPNNLGAQDAFDATYNALPQGVKDKLNTPLVSPPQARAFIQTGAQVAGAGAPNLLRFVESTQAGQGAMDTAANTISSTTTGAAALSMPAFMIPGVAETWAARQAKETPTAWGQVQQAVGQHGMLSREGVAALTQEMVRLGSIGLAIKGGASLRQQLAAHVTGPRKLPYSKPPIQPTKPPPLPASAYEVPSSPSAIANKYQPETAGLGQGSSPAAAIARGSQFTPEQINQHLSDLNQGVGDIQAQTAAVRVEGARLQARSEAAGKALQANRKSIELQKAADDAFKDWADFQNGPQALLKSTWARMGHELQGSVPVDLSSVNGLRQKFFNEMGVEATPDQTRVLAKYADKVERTEKARVSELDKALDEIAKRSKDVDASPDAMAKMREGIANRMGKKQPCRN